MSDDETGLGKLDDYLSMFGRGDKSEPSGEAEVKESAPNRPAIRKTRGYRQRFAGMEGEYVYRSAIFIRGEDGVKRRVAVGETVNVKADGITVRRLRSLWFAERIELKSGVGGPALSRDRDRGIIDMRAIRDAEAAADRKIETQLKKERAARQHVRNREREEAQQRKLAQRAIVAAEEREDQELRELVLEDIRTEETAQAAENLLVQKEREREEAAAKIESDLDEAAEAAAAAEEARVAFDENERVQQEAQAKHSQEKADRQRERQAKLDERRQTDEELEKQRALKNAPYVNKNSVNVDAKEQRARSLKASGRVVPDALIETE